jgi:DHA1 family bicyclomycin/chloramphenicol resistance-like MFS transporter
MQQKPTYKIEFIALMASLMSIVALSIDALLPALPEIGSALGVVDVKDNQLMITMIFLGLCFGHLIVLEENQWSILDLLYLLSRVLFV